MGSHVINEDARRCPRSSRWHLPWPKRAAACLVLWCASIAPTPCLAQPDVAVKAAFAFNFLRFAEWPAQRLAARDTTLTLCLWSADARIFEPFRNFNGRSVGQHLLRVSDIERIDELGRCQALFIPEAVQRSVLLGLLRRSETLDVLTIGDADGFAASGGMIGLVSEGERMRFEVNDKAIKRSGIKVGAQIYQLGRQVQEGSTR